MRDIREPQADPERDNDRRTDAERRLEAIVALLRQDASTTALDGIGEHLEAIYARLPRQGERRAA